MMTTEELQRLVDDADPNRSWRYIESPEGYDGEWMGCGVERNGGDEFVWFDFSAETGIPTGRLIAAAPDLAREVIALREERDSLSARVAAAEKMRDTLRTLIGVLEIASVMPEAIQKVYVPRLDAKEIDDARAALAAYEASPETPDDCETNGTLPVNLEKCE